MHLTNPKAIFVWLSIVSMALPPRAQIGDALRIVGGCTCIASAVFAGYAIIFSTPIARSVYGSLRRWFEGTLAVAFGHAGLRMLISKASTT